MGCIKAFSTPIFLCSRERSSSFTYYTHSKQIVRFIFQISWSTTTLAWEDMGAINSTCMMDPKIYNAAAEGSIMTFKDDNFEQPLEALLTPNKNTVLHIFITNLENGEESARANFVTQILNMCPSLLCQVNVKDETPLHVAARYGHADIVQVLIENAKNSALHEDLESGWTEAVRRMLRMLTKEKDTALHEAVRYNHLKVVELLLINENPNFAYSVNDVGETPLYIAAVRNYEDLVLKILNTCNSPAYKGPVGRTALHAAVLWDNTVMVEEIIKKIGVAITEKTDEEGCTPLHLAAYIGRISCTKLLLQHNPQVAYMKNKEGRTALHVAVQHNNYMIVENIIEMCPDCCELVDNRGWNALHFAMDANWPNEEVTTILKNSSLCNLLNEKNTVGDTPLHQYCRSSTDYILVDLWNHPRVDKMAFNKNNLNACQLPLTNANILKEKQTSIAEKLWSYSTTRFINEEKRLAEEIRGNNLETAAQAHLVVAALITTVTFAAAITMPGGFVGTGDNHEGSAVLRRKAAFKVFIITDVISLVLSCSAVVIHLLMPLLVIPPLSECSHDPSDEARHDFLRLAFRFILRAIGAMVLAFITGAYAVLSHSLDVAVTTCVIGSCFFLIFFFICIKYTMLMPTCKHEFWELIVGVKISSRKKPKLSPEKVAGCRV